MSTTSGAIFNSSSSGGLTTMTVGASNFSISTSSNSNFSIIISSLLAMQLNATTQSTGDASLVNASVTTVSSVPAANCVVVDTKFEVPLWAFLVTIILSCMLLILFGFFVCYCVKSRRRTSQEPLKLFLSYNQQGPKTGITVLVRHLKGKKFTIIRDIVGNDWEATTFSEMLFSDYVIVCHDEHYVKSELCAKELKMAMALKMTDRIVVLRFDESHSAVLDDLALKRTKNRTFFGNEKDGLAKMVDYLKSEGTKKPIKESIRHFKELLWDRSSSGSTFTLPPILQQKLI